MAYMRINVDYMGKDIDLADNMETFGESKEDVKKQLEALFVRTCLAIDSI